MRSMLEAAEKKIEKLMLSHSSQDKTIIPGLELLVFNGIISNVFFTRYEHTVSIYGNFSIDETGSRSLYRFGILPVGFRPKTVQRRIAFGVGSFLQKEIVINPDGFILDMPPMYYGKNSSDTEYMIDISYNIDQ